MPYMDQEYIDNYLNVLLQTADPLFFLALTHDLKHVIGLIEKDVASISVEMRATQRSVNREQVQKDVTHIRERVDMLRKMLDAVQQYDKQHKAARE